MRQQGFWPLARLTIKRTTRSITSDSQREAREEILKYFLASLGTDPKPPDPISNGCYAHVFPHPTDPDKVIKVCNNSPKYLRYIIWCMRHPENPYVPRVHQIEVIRNTTDKMYGNLALLCVVVMERLMPEGSSHAVRYFMELGRVDPVEPLPPALDALKALRQRAKRIGYLDIHCANVMFRGSQPVVTDPIAG